MRGATGGAAQLVARRGARAGPGRRLVLLAAGHGVAFLAAQDDLTRIAPDQQRAEVSAAFYRASVRNSR